jgi:hypothetical protein
VQNKAAVLSILKNIFTDSGLTLLLYGSQVYNPQNGEDFDLIGLYCSRSSLKSLLAVCNPDAMPDSVSRVLRDISTERANPVLDFVERHFSSFRFKFQILHSSISINMFHQPVLERVANGGFVEEYRKIRIVHPGGPPLFKRAALFDGTQLWIPTQTSTIPLDGTNYWLRRYYGWLYEPGFTFVSGIIKTGPGHLITSDIVLQENGTVVDLIESAEKTFVAAVAAYSRERKISVDPCNAFIRAERFLQDFKARIRALVKKHTPDEYRITRLKLPVAQEVSLSQGHTEQNQPEL